MDKLTEEQFGMAQDAVDAALRASKRGTPEREAAQAVSAEWEAAIALPQATWQQREDRLAAISEVATKHSLLDPAEA